LDLKLKIWLIFQATNSQRLNHSKSGL